jgi:glyoxylase-like metal-dependent hydrolase (beta-lactamase superfamily II)
VLASTVARTDLAGPELTEPLARAVYQSLHQRLLPLPDELAVYPTHGPAPSAPNRPGSNALPVDELDARFERRLCTDGPYFFADLADTSQAE